MRSIDLARQLAEAGQKDDAQKGYFLALQNKEELDPKEELEAASYLFFPNGTINSLSPFLFLSIIAVFSRPS